MNFRDVLGRARNAFILEDYPLAEQYAQKLVEAEPEYLPARILYGNILLRQERYEEALAQFLEISRKDGANPEVHNNLGVLYRRLGRIDDALGAVRRAMDLDPDNADIAYNLGNLHKQLGNLEEALKYYSEALRLDPSLAQGYINLGIVYERRGEYGKALDVYTKGLDHDPNNPLLHFNMGVTEEILGDYETAETSYRRGLQLRPDFTDALNNLGIVLEKLDRDDEALGAFEELLARDPGNIRAKNNTAFLYTKKGRYDEAEEFYRDAVQSDPSYLKASKNLGRLKQLMGDHAEAIKHLMDLVHRNPEDAEARVLLANVYIEREHYQDAVENLQFVLDRNPRDEKALSSLSKLYEKTGNIDKARSYLLDAREAARKDRDIHMQEVGFKKRHDSIEQAIEELERLLEIHPNYFQGYLLLGEMYAIIGDNRRAVEIFEDIDRRFPPNEEVLMSLIQNQSALGNKEEALKKAEELVHFQGEGDETEELDRFSRSLEIYEQLSGELEDYNRRAIERNLKSFVSLSEPLEPEITEEMEAASVFIDYLPGLESEEVPILDVGGIDPIIAIHEDEEDVYLSEEEEEIPEDIPEEVKEDITLLEKPLPAGPTPSAPPPQPPPPQPPPQRESGVPQAGPEPAVPPGGETGAGGGESPVQPPPQYVPQPIPYPVYQPPEEPADEEEPEPPPEPEEPAAEEEPALEEEPEPLPAPGEDEAEEPPPVSPVGVLDYLERLTRHLPEDERRRYLQSDMKLKLSAVRSRLMGRKGLREEIESKYAALPGKPADGISGTKLKGTFEFIRGLSKYHPDQEAGFALKHTLSGIMKHMRSSQDASGENP